MIKYVSYASILMALTGLLNVARCETGRLIVTFTDPENKPITNATVTVESPKSIGWGRGCDSEYNYTSAETDTNGVATVVFNFCHPRFLWFATAPSHHCVKHWYVENFGRTVVKSDYLDFDTNTVDGLSRYNELKALENAGDYTSFSNLVAKFEPKSVIYTEKCIERSLMYYPKRNPQPMYFNTERIRYRMPMTETVVTNDSVAVRQYPTVDFDMKRNAFLRPLSGRGGFDSGEVSDFKIIRSECVTNGVSVRSGWIEFAPGCGAYKGVKPGDGSFNGFYEADTNAVFISRIPFEQREVEDRWKDTLPILSKNEYLVIRTRAMMDDLGTITNCHYAAIIGEMRAPLERMCITSLIFNPRPNDPNLECDYSRKLKPE